MSNANRLKDVTISVTKQYVKLDFNAKDFTLLKSLATAQGAEFGSLSDACNLLNEIPQAPPTDQKNYKNYHTPALMSGKVKDLKKPYGVTFGKADLQGGNWLFCDIDVSEEKGENTTLLDVAKNEKVYSVIKKIAPLSFRSFSGAGIAFVVYVNGLENSELNYKDVTRRVYRLLEKEIFDKSGILVKLDDAQGGFAQKRLLAHQRIKVDLNHDAISYKATIKEDFVKLDRGFPAYNFTGSGLGTIWQQFDENNNISDVLESLGYKRKTGRSYKLEGVGSGNSSGNVLKDANLFYIHSGSLLGHLNTDQTTHSASSLICLHNYGGNWTDFAKVFRKARV